MSAQKDKHSIVENGDGVNIEWTTIMSDGMAVHVSASLEGTDEPPYRKKPVTNQAAQMTRGFSQPMRHRRHAR